MSLYRAQVKSAAAAVSLVPGGFAWFGERQRAGPGGVRRPAGEGSRRKGPVADLLQARLYRDFYARGAARPGDLGPGPTRVVDCLGFIEALSAANAGGGLWSGGWRLLEVGWERALVQAPGLAVSAPIGDCRSPAAGAFERGAPVEVRLPAELRWRVPGSYVALGEDEPAEDGSPRLRLYWNVTPSGAVRLVRLVTRHLSRLHVPFQLKVLSDPSRYGRCDPAVLYLRCADAERTADSLLDLHRCVAGSLRPGVPALTLALSPGFAAAEDPSDGGSFGMHRCRLIAEALVEAPDGPPDLADALVERVAERFAREGLSLDKPYLNEPGERAWEVALRGGAPSARRHASERSESDALLEAALAVGRSLAREALWDGPRCAWLDAAGASRGSRPRAWRAMGPDLYAGTSGVGLFLTELHAASGDPATRRAAQGALRHALSTLEAVPLQARCALYVGWTGMALAAARAGALLAEDELREAARRLLGRIAAVDTRGAGVDLISGAAGSAIGLLAVGEALEDGRALGLASRLGEQILRRAARRGDAWSWTTDDGSGRGLTGLSHGASGIACALLELFATGGQPAFREAALGAFGYERSHFDGKAGNWRDLRRRGTPSGSASWCHGAPGIALARLRAWEVLGEVRARDEAELALSTTRAALSGEVDDPCAGRGLCHGLAGNADIVLEGVRALGAGGDGALATVERAARALIGGAGLANARWRSVPENAGLMTGLAGIGYFLLRLRDRRIPSVLLLRREDYAPAGRSSAEASGTEAGRAPVEPQEIPC